MSDSNRIALYESKTTTPFASVPSFQPNGSPVGHIIITDTPEFSFAMVVGPDDLPRLECVETLAGNVRTMLFPAAVALEHALAGSFGLRFEANVCPECKGHKVIEVKTRRGPGFEPCSLCSGHVAGAGGTTC